MDAPVRSGGGPTAGGLKNRAPEKEEDDAHEAVRIMIGTKLLRCGNNA